MLFSARLSPSTILYFAAGRPNSAYLARAAIALKEKRKGV